MMKTVKITIALLFISGLALFAQENYKDINTKKEYTNPKAYDVERYAQIATGKKPKNIILMISDGMGPAQFYTALTANKGLLHILNMKYMGLSKTHSASNYITDSAAGGTAIACGQKTYNKAIGVDNDTVPCKSILAYAEEMGKATGVISTSSLPHATPASFVAHNKNRNNYEAIAADFLSTDVDVMIGGGYDFFSQRKDGRNLIEELKSKDYTVSQSLEASKNITEGKLAVFAAPKHLSRYPERGEILPQATEQAIEILNNNSDEGFFLMVEGSQIDWGGHQNDITYIVEEMLDFDRAVGKALEFAAKDGETLVIVTADHETGGLTIMNGDEKNGYVKVEFSSGHHTGIGVQVFAYGAGAESFIGTYENTELFYKMGRFWGIK